MSYEGLELGNRMMIKPLLSMNYNSFLLRQKCFPTSPKRCSYGGVICRV